MTITQAALLQVMLYQLGGFTTTPVTPTTVHSTVLSAGDGFGNDSSENIYYSAIRWTIKQNGGTDNPWPNGWMGMTVQDLATALLTPTTTA